MAIENITIKGAREHNLKNISLTLPREKLVVITGLSGSGKSSLAFDTIYAEGQRRYVESLSAYARQFLELMEKPDIDYIEGLSPAISIEQKTSSKNPRSTVGTVTEIYDYLRLLYARVGHVFCYGCGRQIASQTVQQITDQVQNIPEGKKVMILAPIVKDRKGEFKKDLLELQKKGFVRARIDGEVRSLEEGVQLNKKFKHTIEAVVDRLIIKNKMGKRLAESIETALQLGEGSLVISILAGKKLENDEELLFSEKLRLQLLRHQLSGTGTAPVLLQQSHRRLFQMRRARKEDGDRPRSGRPRQIAFDSRRRNSSLAEENLYQLFIRWWKRWRRISNSN